MAQPHTNDAAWIEARGLTKSFGAFDVLRGIDLAIGKGEFFTLFGPNGAGRRRS